MNLVNRICNNFGMTCCYTHSSKLFILYQKKVLTDTSWHYDIKVYERKNGKRPFGHFWKSDKHW